MKPILSVAVKLLARCGQARFVLPALVVAAVLAGGFARAAAAEINLALVATPATSFVSGHETLSAVNDGQTPKHSDDKQHGAYGNWPRTGTQWVQYEWSQGISTKQIEVYWFDDRRGVRLPQACRLLFWNGSEFAPVPGATGLGLEMNKFNVTTFAEITTTKLRLEFDGVDKNSTGILEWRVMDSGKSPNFPPRVTAGPDRVVVQPGQTWLEGAVRDDGKVKAAPTVAWRKVSGPGKVTFAEPSAKATTAKFSAMGTYVLALTADDGQTKAEDTLNVWVENAPPKTHLEWVPPTAYQITSPFWRARLKPQIVNWIPHCIAKIDDPKTTEGNIENFVQAGNKLAGKPGARHVGPVFANTWTYNTIEAISLALMVDPQGDAEIVAAQNQLRQKLEDWIPKVLSAQEPDGYIHTQYTIENRKRWSNKHDHEGYMAGYFIEAAIAHHLMTGGKDARMYQAARRLADCWVKQIGPAPKQAWYEGHQELEQALARLARYVDSVEGAGQGKAYLDLAKFLLDSRGGGEEYDQSHLPVTRQYEAVGHAVRAVYSYSGMSDIAMETGDVDYHSAVKSIWHNLVNRKYYVTGGVGSGETAEGFGKDYSLPNNAYCESCAGCGEIFFQHKLQMTWKEGRYADLFEESLFNAVLGSVDLDGQNFTYTNPLDSSGKRYKWHGCPCCVGNIPRTLLMLPTWTYTVGENELYVNLYAGTAVTLPKVAGAPLRIEQTTDYPWNGNVTLTLTPEKARRFALKLRVPDRQTSLLYTNAPMSRGVTALKVNGKAFKATETQGYLTLNRTWQPGDKVELELPLPIQRIKADENIAATRGRVALRRGPLVYNMESADQDVEAVLPPGAPLTTEWRSDLLGGVMVIKGSFANGTPMTAIPNYTRLNRTGRSLVWIKDR